jgi:cephalosporin hydroxylase
MHDIYIDVDQSVEAMGTQGLLLSGVPAMKGPQDLERYQSVIERTRPDLIVQTGTAMGGSALWFANGGPDVITVDIKPLPPQAEIMQSEKITVITGSSIEDSVIADVRALAANYERVMVVLDSDHSSVHVQGEIVLYGPLVTRGCYLVVEDGIYDFSPDGEFKPGPLDAIQKCLADNPQWMRDIDVEAMHPVSMYPMGWWVKQ